MDNSDKLEKLAWQYFENVSQHSWGDLVTFELQLSNAIYIGRSSSHTYIDVLVLLCNQKYDPWQILSDCGPDWATGSDN